MYKYRIVEKQYEGGIKRFVPQYNDGKSVCGNRLTEEKLELTDGNIEDLKWFYFRRWKNDVLRKQQFGNYEDALTIIFEHKANEIDKLNEESLKKVIDDGTIKEIIHEIC